MKTRLTEGKIRDLRPKAIRYEVRDEGLPGLLLRVGKKGDKVWEVVVNRGGKRKRIRLGQHPIMTVAAARGAAQAAKDDARNPATASQVKTVSGLFEKYREVREPRMRSWADIQSVWDKWAKDRIGHVRLSDVAVHHGLDLRDHVAGKAGDLRAAAVIRYIRPMFAWAADEQQVPLNPWLGLRAGPVSQSRDRVLSADEWAAIWTGTFSEGYPFGPLLRALMLSAQRKSNVAQMRWDEIENGVWTIPREKMKSTKSGRAKSHEVPLSAALNELVQRQPRNGPYVFTTNGTGPVHPGSKLKKRVDDGSGVSNWVLHDIRRTAATYMPTQGVSQFTVARVLGHTDQTVTAVYDRSCHRNEKKAALEILACSVIGRPANVFQIQGT